jgi:hypothetical protein
MLVSAVRDLLAARKDRPARGRAHQLVRVSRGRATTTQRITDRPETILQHT